MHALDNASPSRQYSASSQRLSMRFTADGLVGDGDIAAEAVAQMNGSGSVIERFLTYPLANDDLTISRTQAELFARLGVLYIAHPDIMSRAMPKSYEAFHELLQTIQRPLDSGAARVQREVRRTGTVAGDETVRRRGDDGAVSGDVGAGRSRRQGARLEQGDVEAFRRALVRGFGARSDGGLVQGALSNARAKPSSSAARADKIRAQVDTIRSTWANAPDVEVIADMSEAPPAVRRENDAQLSQGADGVPAAFVMGGRIYLVASQLKNDKAVVRAMYHEALGHLGLRGVFGVSLDGILDRALELRSSRSADRIKSIGASASKYRIAALTQVTSKKPVANSSASSADTSGGLARRLAGVTATLAPSMSGMGGFPAGHKWAHQAPLYPTFAPMEAIRLEGRR